MDIADNHSKITWKNAGLVAAGVLAGAAVCAGVGALLQCTTAKVAIAAGEKIAFIGNRLFLAIAVPIYAVIWVVPKWLITKGIPEAITTLHHYILSPLAQYMTRASIWIWAKCLSPALRAIHHVARAIFTHILQPMGQAISSVAKWVWEKCLLPASQALAQAIEALFTHVLKPVGQAVFTAAAWVYTTCLVPLYKAVAKAANAIFAAATVAAQWIGSACQAIFTHALKPMALMVDRAAVWTWKAICVPVGKFIISIAQVFYRVILAPIGRTTAHAATWVWQAAIEPAGRFVVTSTTQAIEAVRSAFRRLAK